MPNRPHDVSRDVERQAAADRKAAEQADAARARAARRGIPQDVLPFEDDDALRLDGHTAVQVAKQRLAERRAMESRCTCGHRRDEHGTQRLLCMTAGCYCSHYRR